MDVPILLTGMMSVCVGSSVDVCSRIVNPNVTVPIPSGTISCNIFLSSQTSFDVKHRRLLSILCGAHSAGSAEACSNVCFDMFCSCILALLRGLIFVCAVSGSEHSDSDDIGHVSLNWFMYSSIVMSQYCAVSCIILRLSFVDV